MTSKIKIKESAKKGIKEIIIARLETLDQNAEILLMGETKPISVKEMLNAVREDSEFGKKILEAQFSYLKMLSSGEI